MERSGRVVVITGAAGGIGRELVAAFLRDGDTIVAVDQAGSGVLELAASLGREHLGEECDIGSEAQIDAETGEIIVEGIPVFPSHYKCPHSGLALEVENPTVWVYPEGIDD